MVSVLTAVPLITLAMPQLYKSRLILAKLLSPVTLLLTLLAVLVLASTAGVAYVQSATTLETMCFNHHLDLYNNLTRMLEVNTYLAMDLLVPLVGGLVGYLGSQ